VFLALELSNFFVIVQYIGKPEVYFRWNIRAILSSLQLLFRPPRWAGLWSMVVRY
jgi:hypothetical protein